MPSLKDIVNQMTDKNEEENYAKTIDDKNEPEKVGGDVNENETITISKEELLSMMQRIERLEETANKARLASYDATHKEEEEAPVVKLRVIDGKVILGWSNMIINNVYLDANTGQYVEEQKVKVKYEDGKTEEMDLVMFDRRYNYIYATVVSEKNLKKKEDIEKYGDKILTVETSDGKKYNIGIKFVN